MLAIVAAPSSAGAVTVPGCVNPAQSALNQYCEVIPGASGAKPPTSGTPTLAGSLPARTVQKIARVADRRVLLSLPAPAKRTVVRGTSNGGVAQVVRDARGSVKPASSTLPAWLFAVLAALALVLLAATLATRRRGGRGPAATSA
jgi:hypothetical protein